MKTITSLILALNTNSIKDRYNAVLEYFDSYPDEFPLEDKQLIKEHYKASREKKVAQGKADAAKRWHEDMSEPIITNPIKPKANDTWLFFPKSKRGARCAICNERYELDDPAFYNKETQKGYHPNCAPTEAKEACANDKFYLNWTRQ